jgi:hypothetical protein
MRPEFQITPYGLLSLEKAPASIFGAEVSQNGMTVGYIGLHLKEYCSLCVLLYTFAVTYLTSVK